MKTFTATELNKSPLKIFRAADKDGSVKINHDRYPDKLFVLEARERGSSHDKEIAERQANGGLTIQELADIQKGLIK